MITPFSPFQMLTNVRRRTAVAAAHWPLVTTYVTATTVPVRQVTPVTDLPAQVTTAIEFSA